MYFGIVTPTEAAALGSLISIIISLAYKELDFLKLKIALQNAMVTSAVVMFIIINSQIFSYAMTISGVGHGASHGLISLGLGPLEFFICLTILYIVLGMFIDGISMMLLTLPLLYPTINAYGFDGVWFGVIIVIFIELGQMTPPMGMNLFAIQTISRRSSLSKIATSTLPYSIIAALLIFILYLFPEVALWLPATIKS
jgi:tripartite ATP-independent transporter DctM subunit